MFPRLINEDKQIVKVGGVWIGLPPKEIVKAYKARKMEYLKKNINRWYDVVKKEVAKDEQKNITSKDIIKTVMFNRREFMIKNRFDSFLIMEEFNVGLNKARAICSYLNGQKKAGTEPPTDL